jgi:hypothetical protein
MMRAKALFIAGMMVIVCFGVARQSEASPCFDQLLSDTAACLAQRDSCVENSSFWTRTCNLSYLACETGAELAYADCMVARMYG